MALKWREAFNKKMRFSGKNPVTAALRGRYWDRTSDHVLHVPQLVEIPTWFPIYTRWQTIAELIPKFVTPDHSQADLLSELELFHQQPP